MKGKTPSLSCLAGKAGDVVVAKDGNQALMVMAACSHGFVAWKLEPVNHGGLFGDSMAYRPIQKQSALGFHFICDLDWLVIPVVPKLLHQHGGLVVVQDGEATPLLVERVKKGFPLTVKQIQSCLSFLGVHAGAQLGKPKLIQMLIEMVLPTDQERENALLNSSNLNAAEEDHDDDSDYEALLQLVEEDGQNRGDPELVKAKQKIKQKKHAKKMAKEAGNLPIKGKGKGKGRKGRGKGRGKGNQNKKSDAEPKAKPKAKQKGRRKGFGRGKKRKLADQDSEEMLMALLPHQLLALLHHVMALPLLHQVMALLPHQLLALLHQVMALPHQQEH